MILLSVVAAVPAAAALLSSGKIPSVENYVAGLPYHH